MRHTGRAGWQRRSLSRTSDTYKHVLTEEEREVVKKYEEERSGGGRQSRWNRPY